MGPSIIQGGMGVGVSSWQLARRVAEHGQLGVVSGTAVAVTVARRLEAGDPGGHIQRALDAFPVPALADRVRARYLSRAGQARGERFLAVPRPTVEPDPRLEELTVVAAFVEVFLAREGLAGAGTVGINLLEKVQLPTLPTLYGAMLAGVDDVLMGAGVPARIPAILDRLAEHADVELPIAVADDDLLGDDGRPVGASARFSPRALMGSVEPPAVTRPRFLAIVSSATLATYLSRVAGGGPDGFVVETPTAGGHNAPPRGRRTPDATEPVYGPRDRIDLDAIRELGRPFWLAGGYGSPERLAEAQQQGATGVQVGTAFAFCEESGIDAQLKRRVLDRVAEGRAAIRTDSLASPTGFPFKIAEVDATLSDDEVAASRPRRCDLGYLREPYRRSNGRIGYRCASEPVADYLAKGGEEADTVGRQCLCNGLVATMGLGQVRRDGFAEPPLITAGDDLAELERFLGDRRSYSAADVIEHLLSPV